MTLNFIHSEIITLKNIHFSDLFDKNILKRIICQMNQLRYRYDPKMRNPQQLKLKQIAGLMEELKKGERTFTDFTILQCKDYNFKKGFGLLIVKFNNFPFVVKLFVETPASFINPFDKGNEPIFFFFMGGGVNRHLQGLPGSKIKRSSPSDWRNPHGQKP